MTSIHSFKRNFNYPRPRKGKQSPARLTTQQYTRIHTKRIISRRKEVR